jgi:hypothetical protein
MTELADSSAWAWSRRRAHPDVRRAFDNALVDGELATCDMVRLELLHSARTAQRPGRRLPALGEASRSADRRSRWGRRLALRRGLRSHRCDHRPADPLVGAGGHAPVTNIRHDGWCGLADRCGRRRPATSLRNETYGLHHRDAQPQKMHVGSSAISVSNGPTSGAGSTMS